MVSGNMRYSSPSALRNRGPISEQLAAVLLASGEVLEIASGSGEHIMYFAGQFPALIWQPSDPSPSARASVQEWIDTETVTNVLPPLDIDASSTDWPVKRVDAIIAINMVHISPWAATLGLLKGAGKFLRSDGSLVLYGPYQRHGHPFAVTNAAFDANLRARNPDWGIRQLEDVCEAARLSGLVMDSVTEMPANNLTVVFRRG